ncbi:MAG: TIGR01212 family radical SAM protein [Deltaproteobacteria bacterium]|nr:TIGR01212 family radical SAM protein [Deltaproteobacteria bacterium]
MKTVNRYNDYNGYLKELFGQRVQKVSIDAGLGCPNRDGGISGRGCIYCDSKGSGSGAKIISGRSIEDQVSGGIEWARKRYGAEKFIAYFQSYTNTNAPVDVLRELYSRALAFDGIVGLSVGTRPDCIDHEKIALLESFKNRFLVWVEYGLQSCHNKTLEAINRGHNVETFINAVKLTSEFDLKICAHVILGLPGETRDMMLETAEFLANQPIHGVKIHSLYVTRGTELERFYLAGGFSCMERDEYIECLIDFLELLPPHLIIQRLTGDPVLNELCAPVWSLEKSTNLNLIKKRLEQRDTYQGKQYSRFTAGR